MANKTTTQTAESTTVGAETKVETPTVEKTTAVSNSNSVTYMKVRNVASRPLEINFSDGGEAQRIPSKSTAYIDEQRLAKSQLATNQVERYVANNCLRILKRNSKKEG